MSLTVSEKNHWKERISRRIEKKTETLLAADPNLMDRIHRDARQRALQSMGLADWQAELDSIEQQKETLDKRSQRVLKAMLAHVRGVPTEDIEGTCYGCYREDEVKSAKAKRQKVHEDELLAECDTGKEVLRLRQEQEDLLRRKKGRLPICGKHPPGCSGKGGQSPFPARYLADRIRRGTDPRPRARREMGRPASGRGCHRGLPPRGT